MVTRRSPRCSLPSLPMALGQMAGTTDIVFMTTNHGRVDKRLRANVLGCFIKSLSLRIDVNPEQSVAELIGQRARSIYSWWYRYVRRV